MSIDKVTVPETQVEPPPVEWPVTGWEKPLVPQAEVMPANASGRRVEALILLRSGRAMVLEEVKSGK